MLLGWSMVVEQAEGGAPEDVGVEPLLSVLVLEGLLPVDGSEIKDAANGPIRQKAEKVAEIAPGFDAVELTAREQGHEGGVDFGGVVTADEDPVLATDRESPFILPMLATWPSCITDGTRSSVPRSGS